MVKKIKKQNRIHDVLATVRSTLSDVVEEVGEQEAYELFVEEFSAELEGWKMRLDELRD